MIRLAAFHRVLNLTKDPGILHGTASNQDTIGSGLPPTSQAVLDRRNISVARNRNFHSVFDLLNKIPIRETLVALLSRAAVDLDMFNPALLGHFRNIDDIYGRIGKAGAKL